MKLKQILKFFILGLLSFIISIIYCSCLDQTNNPKLAYNNGHNVPTTGITWTHRQITVYLSKKINENSEARNGVLSAMIEWNSKIYPFLTFVETNNYHQADIIIDEHSLNKDSQHIKNGHNLHLKQNHNYVLGLTTPKKSFKKLSYQKEQIQLDIPTIEAMYLSSHNPNNQYDHLHTRIMSVTEHELGHAIGLNHTKTPNSIMRVNGDFPLSPIDINAVRMLYD